MEGSSDGSRARTTPECRRLTVMPLGMILDRSFPAVAAESKTDTWDEVVLGLWSTYSQAEGSVRVWLGIDKQSHKVRITIEQIASPWPTRETSAKELALIEAVKKEFPFVEVRVEHFR